MQRRPRRLTVLVDRCGLKTVGMALNKVDGVRALYLDDVYGDERLADTVFLAEAGQKGWAVLTANPEMWTNPLERQTILENGTRVYCLANPQHALDARGFIIGRWFTSLRNRQSRPGPCFWLLDPNRVTKRHT